MFRNQNEVARKTKLGLERALRLEVHLKLHERLNYGLKLKDGLRTSLRTLLVVVVVVACVAQVTNVFNTAFGRRRIHRPRFCRAFVLLLGSLLSFLLLSAFSISTRPPASRAFEARMRF